MAPAELMICSSSEAIELLRLLLIIGLGALLVLGLVVHLFRDNPQ